MAYASSAAITHVMEPVLAGTATVVTVGGARAGTRIYAFRLRGGVSPAPGRGPLAAAKPVRLRVLQRTGEAFTVQIPGGPLAAWALQLDPSFDPARAWVANRPRLDWHWPSQAAAGGAFRLIGRNLVRADLYRTRDPRRPVSMGGLLAGKTVLAARPAGGGAWRRLAVSASSGYEIRARMPAGTAPGEYELRAHNGLGGAAGWSEPLVLRVAAASPWPARVFRADDYVRRAGGSADEGLAAAVAAAAANGGGVLQLGPRPYELTRPLVLPPRTVLRGAGRDRTLLRLPTGEGPKPPFVAVMGDGDFAVEDLCIRGVHAPVLIAAPAVRADTFDEALLAADGFGDRRCRNVAVRRCHLEQNLLWHEDRRTDKEHIRRMADYSLRGGQSASGQQFTCLALRGDDIELEGNTVLGGGHAAIVNRSSYVRVAGNTLAAGAGGHALMFFSHLVWPPGFPKGGGAPIRGNFCHRLLVEDNEMCGRSERARNLLAVLYAGERMHIARNNIHRIAPNSDAEALLTHLWQARWPDASLRMRDALTGEIEDPAGKLAAECLDGASIDVVDGRGVGQVRDIARREGPVVTLDRPWTVAPDATSRAVFTAPAPHRQVTIVDNRVVSQSVNVILWGTTHDAVVDGNYTADGPGITLWSVRLEAKQSVWGGAFFTQIVNNVVDRGWTGPVTRATLLDAPTGIFFVGCRQASGCDIGYDCLGLIVRGNHATNNTGIGFKTTHRRGRMGRDAAGCRASAVAHPRGRRRHREEPVHRQPGGRHRGAGRPRRRAPQPDAQRHLPPGAATGFQGRVSCGPAPASTQREWDSASVSPPAGSNHPEFAKLRTVLGAMKLNIAKPKRGLSVIVMWSAATAIALVVFAAVLGYWRATPFEMFTVPILTACFVIATAMAVRWREWRALPLSAPFLLLTVRSGLMVALRGGASLDRYLVEWFSEVALWFSLPLALAAIAGLWRIFENQARYQEAQQESLEHERRYHHLVEYTFDAFYTADAMGRFTLVNAAAARLFQRRAGELIGVPFYDLVPEPVRKEVRDALETQRSRAIRSSYHVFSLPQREGGARWVAHTVQAIFDGRDMIGFQAVMRDITSQRAAEVALQQSEARMRTLLETMSEGLLQIRGDGRISFANAAAERILGVPRAELEARHCADTRWEFVRPDGTPMPVDEWAGVRAVKERKAVGNAVTGVRRADRSIAWINANAVPASEEEGVVLTFSDISASKQAAENLEIIEFALDSAVEHVLLATREGGIIYANKRALSALGYTTEEIVGRTIFDIDPGLSREDWAETWARAKAGEGPAFESRHMTKQGKSFPTMTSASYFEYNRQGYLFAFVRDISHETELAAQLRQSQKMEAIGTLAGGIAHDFNNILSPVLGFAELAMREVAPDGRVRSFLDEIYKGGSRAAGLVRQILTFSRQGEQKQQPMLLAPVIKEAIKFMRSSLPSTIDFRESIAQDCGPIMADPGQIHQVFVNLCTNAFHAMRAHGGTLTVELAEEALDEDGAPAHLNLPAGRYARLTVADTGHGMDEQTRLRIFEPFFTTKQPGEGTGLGLAMVHGIVKSHKGAVRVQSRPGKGARFDVYLPLCAVRAEPLAEARVGAEAPGGSEHLLVVDDEEPIRRGLTLFFEGLGYTVTAFPDGSQAAAAFEADPQRFALVITDQTMPRMTGFELARRLSRAYPALPILLCTGFRETISAADAREAGVREVVAKPIEMGKLAKTVRGLLDRRG